MLRFFGTHLNKLAGKYFTAARSPFISYYRFFVRQVMRHDLRLMNVLRKYGVASSRAGV